MARVGEFGEGSSQVVGGDLEAHPAPVLLDDLEHGLGGHAGAGDAVALVDGAQQAAFGNSGGGDPGVDGELGPGGHGDGTDPGSGVGISGSRPASNYFYGPETDGSNILPKIKPTTTTDSPFDAIWYQYQNVEHVVVTLPDGSGDYLAPGYEAFVFNELDSFTSQEPFTSESVLNEQPKMPLHDVYLAGDLLSTVVDELLTINTITRQQMVQSFDARGSQWIQPVDNTSKPGWIGSWAINKGNKFYLARLTVGGPKVLVSFSAATPGWAMVQQFVSNFNNTFSWKYLWSNNGHGQIGDPRYPTPIGPTNLYAFGDPDGSGYNKFLVAYPYVCNDFREKTTPGTSGLSQVTLLMFDPVGVTWNTPWSNWAPTPYTGAIDMVGTTAIRFGDLLMFGQPVATPLNLFPPGYTGNTFPFSLNLLRGIFGNSPIDLQYFYANSSPQWFPLWTDNSTTSKQAGGCTGNFGCWNLGNPKDSFYFADLDGNGVHELIAANDVYWQASTYQPSGGGQFPSGVWSLHPGFADPNINGGTLGGWKLGIGDRFVFGHFYSGFAGDLVLCLNPLNRPSNVGYYYNPPILLQWTPNGWVQQWVAPLANQRSLGNWTLYQDLP